MAAAIAAVLSPALSPANPTAGPSRSLSITTAVNCNSPSSAASPASAASPTNVSTPASSCSAAPPIAIRPSTSNQPSSLKSAASMINSMPAAMSSATMSQPRTMSMTSKEWVVPPRPKPGRKPATDTPPTKRKAQNRAAQRAFRERRAARVGELEEQLDEEKTMHEQTVRELQERISYLEVETQTLQSRCQWLESMLEKERQSRGSLAASWDSSQRQQQQQQQTQQGHAGTTGNMRPLQPAPPRDAAPRPVAMSEPRPVPQPFSIAQIVSPPEPTTTELLDYTCGGCHSTGPCACADEVLRSADIPIGCGNCSLGSRCECLEESFRASIASDLKRRLPPGSPPSTSPEEKRQRSDAGITMETDFTALFASPSARESEQPIFTPPTQSQLQPLPSIELRDSCGFCKDGTYCVCADSMMMSATLPAISTQPVAEPTQTHTPPPSDNDVVPIPMEVTATGAIKLPGLRSLQQNRTTNPPAQRTGGCGPNGPGTCAQCLADPKSGLFCRSLAANFARNNPGSSGGGGCCGNGGPGGCCKAGPSASQPETPTAPPPPETAATRPAPAPAPAGAVTAPSLPSAGFGLSLSCADAYKTISSHRHFDEAADDIGSWLPKLRALPMPRAGAAGGRGGGGGGGRDGRAPIEVEAASIMSVLKDFDVRFGRGE